MHAKTLAAALIVASASVANAAFASIHNTCSEDVYLWSVSSDATSDMITIPASSSWSEVYQTPSSGGVSLKLNTNKTCDGTISQFEYTLTSDFIWGDMSNVNCAGSDCPFAAWGWYLDMGSSSCPTRSCDAGASTCTGAYNAYNDDVNTLSCSPDSNISLFLCTSSGPDSKRNVPVLEHAPHRHAHFVRHPHVRR